MNFKSPKLWFLLPFLGGLISRFWLIHDYTFTVPNYDQWNVDIGDLYLPIKLGTFHFYNLFTPFYEHRLVWQKLYDLLLYRINGNTINNVLQCQITAVIFCSIACLYGLYLAKQVGHYIPLALGCACITILPFGWESTTSAFQTQTYFYEFAVFVSCWLFANGKHKCGYALAIAGVFTTATGFIGAVAFGVFLFMGFVFHAKKIRENFLLLAMKESILIGIAMFGIFCIAFNPFDKELKSTSIEQTFTFFFRYLAWPSYLSPCVVMINLLPVSIIIYSWKKGMLKGSMVDFIVMAFIAIVMQSAILAYEKANSHSIFISRYQDQIAPLLILNILSLCLIYNEVEKPGEILHFLTLSFTCSVIVGFYSMTMFCKRDSLFYAGLNKQNTESETMIAYVTKDPKIFYDKIPDRRTWPGRDANHNPEMIHFCEMMKDTNITEMIPLFKLHK